MIDKIPTIRLKPRPYALDPIDENEDFPEVIFDYDRLYGLAERNKEEFLNSKPFPHIVLDNFLEDRTYELVKRNHIKGRKARGGNPKLTTGKFVTEDRLDIYRKRIFYEFGNSNFIKFLYTLTGIDDLIFDNQFLEAGYTTIETGGLLQVHKDFSHNRSDNTERRLNFFIFLNDGWREEWGGDLGFYDLNGNKVNSYYPIGNRCVIFQASDIAYHGHPEPLRCPEDIVRRSMSCYYYTKSTGRAKSKIHFLGDI